jgi:hypothetical protein
LVELGLDLEVEDDGGGRELSLSSLTLESGK